MKPEIDGSVFISIDIDKTLSQSYSFIFCTSLNEYFKDI